MQLFGSGRNLAALGYGQKRSEKSEIKVVWVSFLFATGMVALREFRSGRATRAREPDLPEKHDTPISPALIAYPVI
jgi:hypothetical protein